MKGPKGHLEYLGCGSFNIKKKREIENYKKNKIGMIAGGTGITPMLQVIRAIMKNPDDNTEVWLIFANKTEEDILLRKELDDLPKDRLHVRYTLDHPPIKGWKYSSGYVTEEMCREHLPPPVPESMIFLCGPPPMIKHACIPALSKLGFVDAQVFKF
jgi:cytochrome-b5 reductase